MTMKWKDFNSSHDYSCWKVRQGKATKVLSQADDKGVLHWWCIAYAENRTTCQVQSNSTIMMVMVTGLNLMCTIFRTRTDEPTMNGPAVPTLAVLYNL